MKKSIIIGLFSMQFLVLTGVLTSIYISYKNSNRIAFTESVLVDTKDKLHSTFSVMDGLAEVQQAEEEASKPLESGIKAPAFDLQDENLKKVSLADYKGKKTLLVFSQPSCPYCIDFYPVLNTFQDKKEDVNVVIMQLNSDAKENKKYKKQYGIEVPILAATNTELANYKIRTTPTSVLLDENGKVYRTENPTTLDALEAFVEGE
ncbi:TlpA family protein disulfide reductase [Aquimarina sp. 2201CG14-23]|uniref:TlpA family protein disulfide reductase n=1 Tax=Aquimarina mycalae TaxID=3040073 RepID=UPI002477D8CD|nr:TlpA disulfide reductase family protein [Aquimarina sp. 2201CG14-23]MDH7448167.1 TlpA disulfide reductase family protein [Aquimarina sp. 2201CG14-23]